MRLQGRKIYPGAAQGEALVTSMGISFFGGVDPQTGVVVERGHELEGQSIAGKVLVFPTGKGSTVGSYSLYRLKRDGKAPLAIINAECETITAVGCIIAEIPCVDQIPIQQIPNGQLLLVDGNDGVVLLVPEWLRGSEPGSFAEDTLSRRMPCVIARGVLDENDWDAGTATRLQALIEDMPHGRLRSLQDEAPDNEQWERWLAPYIGQTWLEAPWFVGEMYFFRRILEATGYFQVGAGQGVDPYRLQKQQALVEAAEALRQVCAGRHQWLAALQEGGKSAQAELARLIRRAIWGNQNDLSLWPAGAEQPEAPGAAGAGEALFTANLLIDDAEAASAYLVSLGGRELPASRGALERPCVDFLLDNVGMELAYDLVLADALLAGGLARSVRFHVKPHPTYVSDATGPDVREMTEFLAAATDPAVRLLGTQLVGYLAAGGLRLATDDFWLSPLPGWEMPVALREELGLSDLIISKGDANFRRWLGDRHWPFTTPFQEIVAYRPAPLLALRVLKSPVHCGLAEGVQAEMDRKDPRWMYNGRWGIISFAS
jgi:predicted aconitase with swiveling domain/uncharacterized protein with ATP-grasp and redox domains